MDRVNLKPKKYYVYKRIATHHPIKKSIEC